MPSRLLPWFLILLCACARPPLRPARQGELWVDAAAPGGDGTRERPLRSLADALARPGPQLVHLAPGRYEGPFLLPEGTRLVGAGPTTVLTVASAAGAGVVETQGEASLEALSVEGGGWGLEVGGRVQATKVLFRGQAQGAVRVGAGHLEGSGLQFEAGRAGPAQESARCPMEGDRAWEPVSPQVAPPVAVGVLVEARAGGPVPPTLVLRDSRFTGPYERAVRVRGGATVRLEGTCFQGPQVALSQEGGQAEVERARASGGTGPAFLTVEGTLKLVDVRVQGHEYGVTTNRARLSVRGFTSEHAQRAGLGLTATSGLLEDVVVKDAGTYGALQLTNSDLEVRRFQLEGSREYGVVALQGRLRLRDGRITGVSTADGIAGDGLHLRQVDADVEAVAVHGVKGTCVLATQRAHVVLRDVRLSACELAALAADTHATLEARGIEVHDAGGSVLLALEEGQLRAEALTVKNTRSALVSADCEGQTRVQLRQVDARNTQGVEAPCVQWEPLPRRP